MNDIRNLYAHNLYPNEQALDAIKKFPTYEQVKMPKIKIPPELEMFRREASESAKFGLISFFLLNYLMDIFLDPRKN